MIGNALEAGIDDSKTCNLREICAWKLEMMARHIFAGLWGSKKDILNNVSSLYQIGVFEEYQKAAEIKATVDKEIAKLDEKLKRLMRLRLEDEIPKDSYLELKFAHARLFAFRSAGGCSGLFPFAVAMYVLIARVTGGKAHQKGGHRNQCKDA